MQRCLGTEVDEIDIAVVRGLDRHNFPANHLRRGRVRTVR